MTNPARQRWNEKFDRILRQSSDRECPEWIRQYAEPGPDPLVDWACGRAEALRWWRSQNRFGVGVDVSDRLLEHLNSNGVGPLVLGDLEQARPLRIIDGTHVIRFFYAPELLQELAAGVDKGRILAETYVHSEGEPPIKPSYCLEPGELRGYFSDWTVHYYDEDEETHPEVARLVASA